MGVHLAWSGDYITRIECEALAATAAHGCKWRARCERGEIILDPGTELDAPPVRSWFQRNGPQRVWRKRFLGHVRAPNVLPDRAEWPARRVHLNSLGSARFRPFAKRPEAVGDRCSRAGHRTFRARRWLVRTDGVDDRTSLGDWNVIARCVSRWPRPADRDHVTASAWISACGSSRKWSPRTATFTAHIPTGASMQHER